MIPARCSASSSALCRKANIAENTRHWPSPIHLEDRTGRDRGIRRQRRPAASTAHPVRCVLRPTAITVFRPGTPRSPSYVRSKSYAECSFPSERGKERSEPLLEVNKMQVDQDASTGTPAVGPDRAMSLRSTTPCPRCGGHEVRTYLYAGELTSGDTGLHCLKCGRRRAVECVDQHADQPTYERTPHTLTRPVTR